jgi:thiol-disulfide isomerase/thioredoxin
MSKTEAGSVEFRSSQSDGESGQIESFDNALARSQETSRPIFLYWGTKWCPPCAEMQVTVLRRPQFRARCAHMVVLAIDGDAPGAQACGERVDVSVYPSMLILDRDEREWIRLPCGLKEGVFCSVIDAALRKRMPMSLLVDALYHRGGDLDEDDLTLLAFHYWPQDRRIRPGAERLGFLERLDAAVPRNLAGLASRVLVWHITERSGRPLTDTAPTLRYRLYDQVSALFDSREATFSALYYLLVAVEPVVEFLCENDAGRRRDLIKIILGVVERLAEDPTLSWTERLIAHSARLSLESDAATSDGSSPVLERTRALVTQADRATVGQVERQSVMNMAGHLLRQSGLREESIRLFCREINRSPWPTYFMPYVAEMYMEQGESDEAFRWWRRSYEDAPGKSTRFELGVRYIEALVRHAPSERALIERTVTRLLAERGDDVDTARARTRRSLGLLARTLAQWQV